MTPVPDAAPGRDPLVLASVLLLTALAGLLRAPALAFDPIPDELALFVPTGLAATLWQGENAVNPPLLQVLIKALPAAWMLEVGRAAAWAASVAAVPLAARLAARVAPGPVAPVAAAAVVALHPRLLVDTTVFRAYAFVLPLMLAHLAALVDVAEGRRGRGWLATGLLLPWLHYLAVPLLVAEAVGLAAAGHGRRVLRALPWTGLAWAPLAAFVLLGPSGRVAHTGAGDVGRVLGGLGLDPARHVVLAGGVTGWCVATALAWRWLRPRERVLVGAVAAVWATAAAASAVQSVRAPVLVFLLAPLVPLLASGAPLPARWRPVAGGAWGLALVGVLGWTPPSWWLPATDRLALGEAAAEWRRWDDLRGDADVLVVDDGALVVLHDRLTGRHLDPVPGVYDACPDRRPCFVHEGVRFRAARGDDRGLLLLERSHGPARTVAGCAVRARRAHHVVAWCGAASAAPEERDEDQRADDRDEE